MSEQPPPDPSDLARYAIRQTNALTAALLAATVRMESAELGSLERAAAHAESMELAAKLLTTDYVSPETAVFAAARTGAVLVRALAVRLGVSASSFAETTEMNVFLSDLE